VPANLLFLPYLAIGSLSCASKDVVYHISLFLIWLRKYLIRRNKIPIRNLHDISLGRHKQLSSAEKTAQTVRSPVCKCVSRDNSISNPLTVPRSSLERRRFNQRSLSVGLAFCLLDPENVSSTSYVCDAQHPYTALLGHKVGARTQQ
jgi:hypothetical protein